MAKKLTQNVNKDKLFNDLPKVIPEVSSWLTTHTNYQSCNAGQIVPIYYDEVLPDEEREITMGMTSHTTTPIAPIFNSMYTEIRCFWVPIRLCADLLNGYKTRKSPFVKVFGEDNASQNASVIVSLDNQKLPNFTTYNNFISDIKNFHSMALSKDNVFNSLDLTDPGNNQAEYVKMNFLNLAAYELIYQRHYRNENYESATSSVLYRLLFDAYNLSKSSVPLSPTFTFEYANREKDYFTGMKPFTLKSNSPITIGISGQAPVVAASTNHDMNGAIKLGYKSGGTTYDSVNGDIGTDSGRLGFKVAGTGSNINDINRSNLVTDLSSSTGVSIEQLRLLIKTQELLEKDAMYGSMYAESLNAHFGCCPIDETLQDPAELYRTTISSNMQAIFQTSSTSGESSILGTIGANSTTQTEPFVILPKQKFKEHGVLMICAVHKLQNVYDSVYFKPKFNFKQARFDFYTPELNDLGYQPVSNDEFRSSSNPVAGYNEAFAEYRYKFNKLHGELASNFPYWAPAISNEYTSAATLYKEAPDILDKALSITHSTAPQFYDAWGFEEKNTKPMSLHSIPGMDGVI